MMIEINKQFTCQVWARCGGKPGPKPNPESKRQKHFARREEYRIKLGLEHVTQLPKGKRGLRPQIWITGPDPRTHKQYHCWQLQKVQATYRSEEYDLTFEEYKELWDPHWEQRGRTRGTVCMTRIDWEGAWTKTNVEIVPREEHLKRQRENQMLGRGRMGKNPWRFQTKPKKAKKEQLPPPSKLAKKKP